MYENFSIKLPGFVTTIDHVCFKVKLRAVTIAGAACAIQRGPSTKGPRIATFYYKIFL